VEQVRLAATLHDLGMMLVPARYLCRPGPLAPHEMGIVRTHPQAGHDLLAQADFGFPLAEIVLQHHERLDGSGYPAGLRGDQIMPEARIIAVADVVEAMCSHRSHRPSPGLDRACQEIGGQAGVLYDARVAELCLDLLTVRHWRFAPDDKLQA
jgi:HD-GYP domain-containing protein (c-di-GMP phosphodiesterase class II)